MNTTVDFREDFFLVRVIGERFFREMTLSLGSDVGNQLWRM